MSPSRVRGRQGRLHARRVGSGHQRARRAAPELWGGSADLAESNLTTIKDAKSFIPAEWSTHEWSGDPYGRVLHFGIREHAMGAIVNGIKLHGPTRRSAARS
jgi:transketolase